MKEPVKEKKNWLCSRTECERREQRKPHFICHHFKPTGGSQQLHCSFLWRAKWWKHSWSLVRTAAVESVPQHFTSQKTLLEYRTTLNEISPFLIEMDLIYLFVFLFKQEQGCWQREIYPQKSWSNISLHESELKLQNLTKEKYENNDL